MKRLHYFPFLTIFLLLLASGTIRQGAARDARRAAPQAPSNVTFVDSGQNLGDVESSGVAMGDLDGDGDLDAFVTNATAPDEFWINQGGAQGGTAGIFADSGQALGNGLGMDVSLGDLDGDGDLDAFVLDDASTGSIQVWINQGGDQGGTAGLFLHNGQTIGDSLGSAVALGDLNGDGFLDAFIANNLGRSDKVWWNDGNGQFSDSGQALGTDSSTDVALADLDGDGDLDAYAAADGANRIWINQGGVQNGSEGAFVGSGQVLGNTFSQSVALGDLDGDGDLDVFVGNGEVDKVWLNQGNAQGGAAGVFVDSGQVLGVGQSRGVALADLDGDGDLDAFVAKPGPDSVWVNQGGAQTGSAGVFLDSGQQLGESYSEAVALGDVDGDMDIDAFVGEWSGPNKVWLNQEAGPPPPPPPSAAEALHFIDSHQFSNSSDSNAVALADLDGDRDLDAFLANGATISGAPNEVWLNDGGSQGGLTGNYSDSGQRLGDASSQDVALGDIDQDGDVDAFVVNWSSTAHPGGGHVWLNDGQGAFSDAGQATARLPSQAVALGDLNGDGDLDAFVVNYGRPHFVYVNLSPLEAEFWGTGQELGTDSNQGYDVALGDLDNDGDLDAFVADGSGSQVWLNNGEETMPTFTQATQSLPPAAAVALGDLNGDSYVDAFTGNRVLWNNGDGNFTDSDQSLDNFVSDVGLADLDGDEDLDAFVARNDGAPDQAWINVGDGFFAYGGVSLGDGDSQNVTLGDVDRDGDVDAFVTNVGSPNKVWLNFSCAVEFLTLSDLSDALLAPLATARQTAIDLQTFYRVRDEILRQSPGGQHYTDLYYAHNAEILGLLIADDALRAEATAVLETWQPNLQALVDGEGDSAVITQQQAEAVDHFLDNLMAAGSPALQQTILSERQRLGPSAAYAGMTMSQARRQVTGYGVYLPVSIHE